MRTLPFVAALVLAISGCAPSSDPHLPQPGIEEVLRLDSRIDAILAKGVRVEKVAGGFRFTEGPLWRRSGVLWFSDLVGNAILQWTPPAQISDILRPGGYGGNDAQPGAYVGPNGIAAAPEGAVLVAQHGNRRIIRLTSDFKQSILVDRFEGKRLNSPNDLVFSPDGSLYFTDPPYGLPKQDEDPAKELTFNGIFRLAHGKLQLLSKELLRPNGLAFAPDYKTLYVANSEPNRRLWMRYDVAPDGTLTGGRVFADASGAKEMGVPDGLKVDSAGNVFASGPGGVWVLDSEGQHLGTIRLPEAPSNCAWGDDGKTLYITAETALYKVRTNIPGLPAVYR